MDTLADLAAILPPQATVRVGGADYTLRPVVLGQVPGLLSALKPLAPTFAALDLSATGADRLGSALLTLLLEHPQVLVEVLSATSGLPRATLDAADLAETVDLLSVVIELNADFFIRAVAPRLARLIVATSQAIPAAPGPTPSSG
jgi:hypothetical protein